MFEIARRDIFLDEDGVRAKFGVRPILCPTGLRLLVTLLTATPGFRYEGSKSASSVLSRFGHLEQIPGDPTQLGIPPTRAARLLESFQTHREEALLYRLLATLQNDIPIEQKVSDLEWRGAASDLAEGPCPRSGDRSAREANCKMAHPQEGGLRPGEIDDELRQR